MKTPVTCSACGVVLAHATEPDSTGLVVRSPDCQNTLHIVPRGRTVLHCTGCGAVRVWYPPRPARKRTRTHTRRRSSEAAMMRRGSGERRPEMGAGDVLW